MRKHLLPFSLWSSRVSRYYSCISGAAFHVSEEHEHRLFEKLEGAWEKPVFTSVAEILVAVLFVSSFCCLTDAESPGIKPRGQQAVS